MVCLNLTFFKDMELINDEAGLHHMMKFADQQ